MLDSYLPTVVYICSIAFVGNLMITDETSGRTPESPHIAKLWFSPLLRHPE